MSISYFIKNGKIALTRYKVSYTVNDESLNVATNREASFDNEKDYLKYVAGLDSDVKYTVDTVSEEDLKPYLQYEGLDAGDGVNCLNPDPDVLLAYKIQAMSDKCEEEIVKGFDITLSDNTTSHFSLTEKDQIRMLGLAILSLTGLCDDIGLPYHADNGNCTIYSMKDFKNISTKGILHVLYQATYNNQLKQYLKQLRIDGNIVGLHAAYYGMELPEKYNETLNSIVTIMSAINQTNSTESTDK